MLPYLLGDSQVKATIYSAKDKLPNENERMSRIRTIDELLEEIESDDNEITN